MSLPSVYMGPRDSNPGLLACLAYAFTNEPSPSSSKQTGFVVGGGGASDGLFTGLFVVCYNEILCSHFLTEN